MGRQGGIKGWDRSEGGGLNEVVYSRYMPDDEVEDPRSRRGRVQRILVRGNEEEGYVVIMEHNDRDGSREGNHSREFQTLEDAEDEAKKIAREVNEERLFRTNTSVSDVMEIISDIASDKSNDQYTNYNIDHARHVQNLAEFASTLDDGSGNLKHRRMRANGGR